MRTLQPTPSAAASTPAALLRAMFDAAVAAGPTRTDVNDFRAIVIGAP